MGTLSSASEMRITGISSRVVDTGDRDRTFVRVDTEDIAAAHLGVSPAPRPVAAPDGGLLDR